MTALDFNKQNSEATFSKIMNSKGEIAPIAEKACRNFELKTKNAVNKQPRLHYFAVGHTFKQLDTESIFGMELDDTEKKKIATRNISLQIKSFDDNFIKELDDLLGDIRNINSHYVHDFEKIKLDKISAHMQKFIHESFALAVQQVYQKEESTENLVDYLYAKFFPLDKKKEKDSLDDSPQLKEYKKLRAHFKTLTEQEALDTLLFVNQPENKAWKLNDEHTLFSITQGKYLSFYGCLFLLSLFLYKSEANQLISKIKGFKKNETPAEQSKRDIFTFFSKKFTSQDINSEENHLIKFRDIIQYLNHYPVEWTKKMELQSDVPLLTDRLKDKIIEMEIDRAYPTTEGEVRDTARFHLFARYCIWGKNNLGKSIEKQYIDAKFTDNEIEQFNYIIKVSDKFKNAEAKLEKQQAKYNKTFSEKDRKKIEETKREIEKLKDAPNTTTEKLKERIKNNMLYMSYGRNQDRFMLFAARYLAETNYFGKDAQFKTYRFYNTLEQNEFVDAFKMPRQKKEKDDLPYHQGKVTIFRTWTEHLANYPEWDTPFVVENNAIQVTMRLGQKDNAAEKTVSIQRALLIYFLEDALFHCADKVKDAGLSLLTNYYYSHQREFAQDKEILANSSTISVAQKASFKKLWPKRLLHHYAPAVQNNMPERTTLQNILDKAKKAEKRYEALRQKAKDNKREDDFLKRNKGKQFKLRFMRKVWNLMFFKQQYVARLEHAGEHHKEFHITRDEYNDFCRYLFAFDQVPEYKTYLTEMLQAKGFLENETFNRMLNNAKSLDSLYLKTKQEYEKWLTEPNSNQADSDKYTLSNYTDILSRKIFYINLSHFIKSSKINQKLDPQKTGKLKFSALENKPYLIDNYYTDTLVEKSKETYKSYKKMFYDLQTSRLEDALLYEIALCYLLKGENKVSKANLKNNVIEIQKNDINFEFNAKDGTKLFELIVPFKNLDRYSGLKSQRDEIYWEKLVEYLIKVKNNKDTKAIYELYKTSNKITLDNLNKLYAHFVGSAINFSRLVLCMEAYFIFKERITIKMDNNITYEQIPPLNDYFTSVERNNTFHFDIQEKTYEELISGIEPIFITNEVKPDNPKSYSEIYPPQRSVCKALLSTVHNEFYGKEKDGKKKQTEAENKYYNEIIKKHL